MAKVNEVTSTEKLLDVIRGKSQMPEEESKPAVDMTPFPSNRAATSKAGVGSSSANAVTIGIDISYDNVRFVKTGKVEGKLRIIDCGCAALSPQISKDSPEFDAFLKAELNNFIGSEQNVRLWANIPASSVEIRHIRIPKVSDSQLENAVFWTLKKESPFDEKEMILDFEVQNEVLDQGVTKLSVMTWMAPKKEVEHIKEIFSTNGFHLAGVTIAPFAIQNIFRSSWITSKETSFANLFIENDFSHIDIYSNGNLIVTRDIKAGTNSMIESIVYTLGSSRNTHVTYDEAKDIFSSLGLEEKAGSRNTGLTDEDLFQMISPALERLVRQIERTLEYSIGNLGNERINNIYISGNMNIYMPMIDFIASQLGLKGEVLHIPEDNTSCLCKGLKSVSISQKSSFMPAVGLSLSDNANTPNLLFTYKDKEKSKAVTKVNNRIFAAFMGIVVLCSIVYAGQLFAISSKKTALAKLERELTQAGPAVNQSLIVKMMGEAAEKSRESKQYLKRYMGVAVINEISSIIPPNMKITGLKIDMAGAKDLKDKDGKAIETVSIDGVISGAKGSAESALSAYIMKLDASLIFKEVVIQSSDYVSSKGEEGLHVTINMKIG